MTLITITMLISLFEDPISSNKTCNIYPTNY